MLKDYDSGMADLNSAIALDSKNANLYRFRGVYRTWRENYAAAVPDFTRAITMRRNYISAYEWRARAYGHMGKFPLAMSDLWSALKADPKNAGTICAIAYMNYQMGKYDDARKGYAAAAKFTKRDDDYVSVGWRAIEAWNPPLKQASVCHYC